MRFATTAATVVSLMMLLGVMFTCPAEANKANKAKKQVQINDMIPSGSDAAAISS